MASVLQATPGHVGAGFIPSPQLLRGELPCLAHSDADIDAFASLV